MTTATIRASSNSGFITSADDTHSKILDGTASNINALTATDDLWVGSRYSTSYPEDYLNRCMLVEFDLTSIPSGSTINSADFKVTVASGEGGKSGSLVLVSYDYGASIEVADYMTSASYAAKTSLASWTVPSSVSNNSTYTFTSSTLKDVLTAGQINRFYLNGSQYRTNTAPTSYENAIRLYCVYAVASTKKPTLEIDYTEAGGSTPTSNSIFFGAD